MADVAVSELTLSRIWQDGRFTREMRTTDGRRLSVIYGGVWSHQDGPDFLGAMVELEGRLVRGAVELHLRASDWDRHGHSSDPAYDAVILHVVLEADRRVAGPAGVEAPTVVFSDYLREPLETLAREVFVSALGALGRQTCLPTLPAEQPEIVHDALRRAGWRRLSAKTLRFSQEFERAPAGEALYRGLLDALGYTENRAGMAVIADQLPLALLEDASGSGVATALLLGAGGFLPLAPAHAALASIGPEQVTRLERTWTTLADEHQLSGAPSSIWSLRQVRPVNHPARRLASLGDLVERAGRAGLLGTLLALPLDNGRSWRAWLDAIRPSIGRARSDQIQVNVFAPFLAAYADATGNVEMGERASELWERLPGAADDAVAKGALRQIVGERRFGIRLAIEAQGLHEIGRNGCRELRCFECPIAALAVMHEPERPTPARVIS